MTLRKHALARLGAIALLAAGVLTGLASPASAAGTETDLSVEAVVGTRMAAGAEAKVAVAKIKNNGPGTPADLHVLLDTSEVDYDKVVVEPVTPGACTIDGTGSPELWACSVDREAIPEPGETIEIPIVLFKPEAGVELPYSAPITASIQLEDDTDPSNNSADTVVELTDESGVDLGIIVPDVNRQIDSTMDPEEWKRAPLLVPGAETAVIAEIINQGDAIADGVEVTVTAPKGVTFSQDLNECAYSSDRRVAECTSTLLQLAPSEVLLGVFPVKVGADVKAPVALQGGSATIKALGELPATTANTLRAQETTPTFIQKATKEQAAEVRDIDESDNTDDYAVVVAAKGGSGGGGGEEPGGGSGGGDGDDDGEGLPVTGVQAGLIGGVGAGVIAAGAALMLLGRRRREVLLTPGDETPSA
jgi:hypothetical protein